MTAIALDEMIIEWDVEANGIIPEESTLPARLEILMLRLLAEGHPVSAEQLALAGNIPVRIARAIFERGKQFGGEWDDEGCLVGNVLTLNPTPHHFRVNGNDMYTWCSLDAIHLPRLLNHTAEVHSTDPISGDSIHLSITPDGKITYHPSSTVLSIALEGGERSGPQSALCRRMHFFASHETADKWLTDYPDVSIMKPEAVYQLVHEHIHAPLEAALQALG